MMCGLSAACTQHARKPDCLSAPAQCMHVGKFFHRLGDFTKSTSAFPQVRLPSWLPQNPLERLPSGRVGGVDILDEFYK